MGRVSDINLGSN